MHLDDFDYHLPPQLIAQHPTPQRRQSRLLQVTARGLVHGTFADIGQILQPGDHLVVNNTRVIKARLFARKDTGGEAEILLERMLDNHLALCHVRVSKPLKTGRTLKVAEDEIECRGRRGQFYLLHFPLGVLKTLDLHGHVPLPPYIQRRDGAGDQQRYQTVYNKIPGAVAAPTAGLHFDDTLLDALRTRGVTVSEITLHVGSGTFQPVRGPVDEHKMHEEWYDVPAAVGREIMQTRRRGGKVIAVGTTVVRSLESAALNPQWPETAAGGFTKLFIKPGFEFRVTDALITNFHLPRSTLLMLVCAFAGQQRILSAYAAAVAEKYRFFSYGDAMYLEHLADV